ncbi:FecCD family ABC transporter permease [Streptomyces sp. NPDC004562]|uniref:FecCD family ABC transporter permease n=1 Tax=Streptomyces sp. NPDC004562 TaxID=3364703 RepID=UPI0036B78997
MTPTETATRLADHRASAAPSGGFLTRGLVPMLVVLLVASAVAGIVLGSFQVPPAAVVRVLAAHLGGDPVSGPDVRYDAIVWGIRLPRVLLGALVGAGLAMVGTVLQTLLRNPLADPFVLGTSYGAGVGAVSVTLGASALAGVYTLSAGAFAGALAATAVVFAVAQAHRGTGAARLLLAGVAVSFVGQAITNVLVLAGDDSGGQAARAVLFWLLGGLGGARWTSLVVVAAATCLALPLFLLRARALDALLLGEQTAASLGLRPSRLRTELFVVTALLTGALVAVSGAIGFVGLMMPLFTRLLLRTSENARILPVAALLGAVFLLWADLAARVVIAPAELPVGVVTALCGGPVFLWLLLKRGGSATTGLGGGGAL